MSSHQNIKIHANEVAIHFTSNRGVEIYQGEGQLKDPDLARAFAICYAISTQPRLYEIFRQILRNDLISRKVEETNLDKRIALNQLIELLTIESDDKIDTTESVNASDNSLEFVFENKE